MMLQFIVVLFSFVFLVGLVPHNQCSIVDIKAIQDQLNDSKTLEFSFIENKIKSGNIYIKKPGMIRIDYESPDRISIVSNNNIITYYDHQLSEMTKIKQDPKFLTFLSKDKIDFQKDFKTFSCTQQKDHLFMRLSLEDQEGQEIILNLAFLQHNLSEISIITEKGLKSVINLRHLKYNKQLPLDKFNLKDKRFYDME